MSPEDRCHCKHPRSEHAAYGCGHKLRAGALAYALCECLGFRLRLGQGQNFGPRRFLRPSVIADIRYRARMGYPGRGRGARFEQVKADVATLLAEVDNLKKAVGGFLAEIPPLAIKGPAPANDGGHGGTNGSIAGTDEGNSLVDRKHHFGEG